MVRNIILDLDMTLVDSSCAEEARKNRDWGRVYSLIPKFRLYEGVMEFVDLAKSKDCKIGIVSTAPGIYVKKVVDYFKIPIDYIVGYFDAKPVKPDPAPMLKALELSCVSAEDTISFGDRAIDMMASNRAGIRSIGCLWGSTDNFRLKQNADIIISSPFQMKNFLY